MPTTKHRHSVTETPAITEALHAAEVRWPQDRHRPSRLLARLIDAGRQSIQPEVDAQLSQRRAAVRQYSGAFTGLYEPGYLEQLRDEWPE